MGWLKDLAAGAKEAARDVRDPVVRESKQQDRIAHRVARIEERPPPRKR